MVFFDNYPEFITNDPRSRRGVSTVTAESLTNRHESLLPSEVIKGCTILDLGSCYGASGQWCLSNGASYYTGIEVQSDMAQASQEMLSNYWTDFKIVNSSIEDFVTTTSTTYDITIIFGVLYAFLDQYGLLKKVAAITNKIIIVDTIYPRAMMTADDSIIEIITNQHINSSQENTAYVGVGACISPVALSMMMSTLGFNNTDGIIYPTPLTDNSIHDSYNTIVARGYKTQYQKFPMRFLCRFKKGNTTLKSVNDVIKLNDRLSLGSMPVKPKELSHPQWVFDTEVANRYAKEAACHIPDYSRVIDLCVTYTDNNFDKTAKIIDIGSANGDTLERFFTEGYTNITGVECSQEMYAVSKHQDRVIISDRFTGNEWDVVLANWTLHFIADRRPYLQDIYHNMAAGGMLILSDKMSFTNSIDCLYDNFKRSNGITDNEILKKKASLIGVLTTKPCKWYLDTLQEIGFEDIQIVNANMMFNTIYARKY